MPELPVILALDVSKNRIGFAVNRGRLAFGRGSVDRKRLPLDLKAVRLKVEETGAGLLLLGSYCATDLSGTQLPVLSIGGEQDGLSTPEKIDAARPLLPADAVLVAIPGASHASFGDYGPQAGDGTPTATDADVEAVVVTEVGDLAASLR